MLFEDCVTQQSGKQASGGWGSIFWVSGEIVFPARFLASVTMLWGEGVGELRLRLNEIEFCLLPVKGHNMRKFVYFASLFLLGGRDGEGRPRRVISRISVPGSLIQQVVGLSCCILKWMGVGAEDKKKMVENHSSMTIT